ncbi:hypothetical protein [Embleya scabrispora]|nr:hypothetical protein [Embleya scabrispora]
MDEMESPLGPEARSGAAFMALSEVAWCYPVDEVEPADLPMIAAEALAAGLESPALCELAGLGRGDDVRDLRDLFEQALAETGIELPSSGPAWRYALRRLAARIIDGNVVLADVAWGGWSDLAVETEEEREFVSLLPECACCVEYTLGYDAERWASEVRAAAIVLNSSPGRVGPAR